LPTAALRLTAAKLSHALMTYCIKRWKKSLIGRSSMPEVLEVSKLRWTFDYSRAALFSSFEASASFLRDQHPECHDERYWYAPSPELEMMAANHVAAEELGGTGASLAEEIRDLGDGHHLLAGQGCVVEAS
jgi:hypothetical protein